MLQTKTNGYQESVLNFGIRFNIVPIRVNNKYLAARIFPLYQVTKQMYQHMDSHSQSAIHEKWQDSFSFLTPRKDKLLKPHEFLEKNRCLHHVFLITHNTTIITLGLNTFELKQAKPDNFEGISLNSTNAFTFNYPHNSQPKYLGKYHPDQTAYQAKNIFKTSLAQAALYITKIFPDKKLTDRVIEVGAAHPRVFNLLTNLGLKPERNSTFFLTYKFVKTFLAEYDKNCKQLVRPEANGLDFKNKFESYRK